MNHRAIEVLMTRIAPIIHEHIVKEIGGLVPRIDALEKREPLRGEKGDPGERGERGEPGERGADGVPGRDGVDGINGEDGAPGAPGERGEPGELGLAGADGADGRDGINGADGVPGERGEKGDPGRDGAPAELSLAPDDVAHQISKGIALLAESPAIISKAAPMVLNISMPPDRRPSSKTITTRRDAAGNLVADVVEAEV